MISAVRSEALPYTVMWQKTARPFAARERPHAADLAEQVVDDLPVELVVGERILALLQRERAGRHEGLCDARSPDT